MKNQILGKNRRISRLSDRRAAPLTGVIWCALPVLFASGWASAAQTVGTYARLFDPYVGVLVENDSNLFDVSPVVGAVKAPHGAARLSDTVYTYRVGTEFNYLLDQQHL